MAENNDNKEKSQEKAPILKLPDAETLYNKLRNYLDTLPIGYPKTESGVEMKLLKRLFSPEEAMVALKLGMIPQKAYQVFKKLKRKGFTEEYVQTLLDNMLKKGLINGGKGKDGKEMYYSIAYLAIGIFEYQVGRLTKDFAQDFVEYVDEKFMEEFYKTGIPQLRTIPAKESLKTIDIEEEIVNDKKIMLYDDIDKLLDNASDTISLTECVCRQTTELLGHGCEHTKETCLQFGGAAHYYIDNGLGRQISKEEARQVLINAQEEGLVLQPSNTEKPFAICCCCGCSCEILSHARKLDKPAQYFASNYNAQVNTEECTGCGTCETRCHMDAIAVNDDGVAQVDLDRCIGCGVCVPTCPTEAVKMVLKQEVKLPLENTLKLYQAIGKKKAEMKNQSSDN